MVRTRSLTNTGMIFSMQRFGLVAALICAVGHATVVSSGHDVQERHVDASKQCSYYMEGPAFAAEKYGKYFGTATAVGQWSDKPYTDILDNEAFFGSLTPSMGMKVGRTTHKEQHLTDLLCSGTILHQETAGSISQMRMRLRIEQQIMASHCAATLWCGLIKHSPNG